MTAGMILNTAGVFFFINAQPHEWYESGGLVTEVFYMLLALVLVRPIIAYLDPGYLIRGWMRRKLTEEKLEKINILQTPPKPEDAEDRKKAMELKMYFLRQFEPSELDNARRYAFALTTFIGCVIYTPVSPLFSLMGLIGIVLQYVVDKYMLLRWYKRPAKPSNAQMAMLMTKVTKVFVPFSFALAVFIFLTPSWEEKFQVGGNFVTSAIISLIAAVLPLGLFARALLKCRGIGKFVSSRECAAGLDDYYNAQHMWAKEMKYHKNHFIYKCLSEDKNPEILSPDSKPVKVEDVRRTYGVAIKKVASSHSLTVTATTSVKGGHVIATEPATPSASKTPEPTVFGIGTPVAAPAGSSVHVPLTAPPTASTASVKTTTSGAPPIASTASVKARASGHARWEYDWNGGWRAFADDCQSFMEKKHKEFKEGSGKAQFELRTVGTRFLINFENMTSNKVGTSMIRPIRRMETE